MGINEKNNLESGPIVSSFASTRLGTMSTYRAKDKYFGSTCIGTRVTIDGQTYFKKQLRPELANEEAYHYAFKKEFEVGHQFESTILPHYYSLHEEADETYMLIEYIEGVTLQQKLEAEPDYFRKTQTLRDFLSELTEGVSQIHRRHIVHADLQPNNIMLTRIDGSLRIIDLGYCYTDSFQGTQGRTLGFSAPEISLDVRSDVYSVGRIIQYIEEAGNQSIHPWLRHVAKKCTNESPSMRYQNIDEVKHAIEYLPLIYRKSTHIIALLSTFLILAGLTMWHYFRLPYDFSERTASEEYEVYYNITNRDSLWVEVVGSNSSSVNPRLDLIIRETITHGGKTYKVRSIGEAAFQEDSICSVVLPPSIRSIGRLAFAGCKRMKVLNLPDVPLSIGEKAFWGCDSITDIHLSTCLANMDMASFAGLRISSVTVPPTITELPQDVFGFCINLSDVKLPPTLTRIGRGAFWSNLSLNEITIPASVREIGEYAFTDCNNLTDIYMLCPQPPHALSLIDRRLRIHVRPSALDLYKTDTYWSKHNLVADIEE